MGLRFHKSIRLLPFLRLNFSKSGISFSLGRPGGSLNFSQRGVRGSVGVPGAGVSYRKTLVGSGSMKSGTWRTIWRLMFWGVLVAVGVYMAFVGYVILKG